MSKIRYTAEDLNVLDERCYAIACELGPRPPLTLFDLVQSEDMYDIAARGLPGRYSHYQFGRSYEQQKRSYDTGKGRIYELVINTKPVKAYLLDGNSFVAQLLVIAHVYGHAVTFEHNAYFKPADKNILSRVHSGAERIDNYIIRYGRTEVENFIDSCEALQYNSYSDQLYKRPKPKAPEFKIEDYDELFPEETTLRRLNYERDKRQFRHAFPKEPERDILRFIEKHSPRLEDWQKDIISIIRTEREYFAPQVHTKVLNEGVASYYHQHIVQKIMGEDDRFTTEDFVEFQAMNASVLHPVIHAEDDEDADGKPVKMIHCDDYNPYLLGYTILKEIDRIAVNPTKDEKERWDWAGKGNAQEKRNELIAAYDDVALLPEFITASVCEKAKLFMEPRPYEKYKKLHVSEKEAEEVRILLSKRAMTKNMPIVEITNGDGRVRGELWIDHLYDPNDRIGLDEEYAKGTIEHLAKLWGRAVVVHSLDSDQKECWYYCPPDETPTVHSSINF